MSINNKRGQVTIFIIVALVIVAAILVFFLWIKPSYITPTTGQFAFESCVEDVIEEEILTLGETGGYIKPEFYYNYQGYKIPYYCYTNEYYKPCVVQQPLVKQNFEEQLLLASKEKIYSCFESSVDEFKARGYDVREGEKKLNLEINPEEVVVKLNAPVTLSQETSQRFTDFEIKINSPIYDLLMISTSILQFEAKYGDSDTSTTMFFYPNLIIDKYKQGEGTTIYLLEDKQTRTKLQFASRSYAWPPGYGLVESGIEG